MSPMVGSEPVMIVDGDLGGGEELGGCGDSISCSTVRGSWES